YSKESCYLENDDFIGVRKDYGNGGKYAFVGLLPKAEGDLEKSINKLNGEKLAALMQSGIDAVVKTAIPKFKCEYEIEMKEALENMGMTNAFDSAVADFTKLGSSNLDGNIFVSEVLQKTYIAVDEKGTKAAAATAVDLATESAVEEDPEVKRVYLDRPFIYLIMDVEHNVPLFMGTVCTFE
ncbi:MAG: serpin family protein, partial [Bacillota bacterium]